MPILQDIVPQTTHSIDGLAISQFCPGIHRIRSQSADGIVLLKRKAVGINLLVALGAGGLGAVFFNQLSRGESIGHNIGQLRHLCRRLGQAFSQQRL